jgi:hypothetical protein
VDRQNDVYQTVDWCYTPHRTAQGPGTINDARTGKVGRRGDNFIISAMHGRPFHATTFSDRFAVLLSPSSSVGMKVGLAGSPICCRARAGKGAWPVSSHRHEPRHGKPETTGDKLRPEACRVTTSARTPLARTVEGRGADLQQRNPRPVNRPGGRSIPLCALWFHFAAARTRQDRGRCVSRRSPGAAVQPCRRCASPPLRHARCTYRFRRLQAVRSRLAKAVARGRCHIWRPRSSSRTDHRRATD